VKYKKYPKCPKCTKCQDKGFIIINGEYNKCDCISETQVVEAFARALEDLAQTEDYPAYYSLYQVTQFLPYYPVMAALEAEYQKLNYGLISLIRNSFHVLPLA